MKANGLNARATRFALGAALLGASAMLVGCNLEMRDDSHLKPYEASPVFKDGRSSRPLVAGTVPHRDNAQFGTPFLTGMNPDGQPTAEFPMPVTAELLERGQKEFNIYCSVCHGYSGYADGVVVRRGFPQPPSYHIDRLRRAPVGHIYDVITNGYGVMYSYSDRVSTPEDRWAVVAYVRALQLSQFTSEAELTPEERTNLDAPASVAGEHHE